MARQKKPPEIPGAVWICRQMYRVEDGIGRMSVAEEIDACCPLALATQMCPTTCTGPVKYRREVKRGGHKPS